MLAFSRLASEEPVSSPLRPSVFRALLVDIANVVLRLRNKALRRRRESGQLSRVRLPRL